MRQIHMSLVVEIPETTETPQETGDRICEEIVETLAKAKFSAWVEIARVFKDKNDDVGVAV